MKLFLLSKENLSLSVAEAERLHGVQATERHEDFLLLDTEVREGLAFTREIHEVLFEATSDSLDRLAAAYPWEKHVGTPFAVAARERGLVSEREFAGHIWRALQEGGIEPSVDLKEAASEIHLFSLGERVLVTRLCWRNEERFFDRRAHLRPRNHPTSLNPKLARAMVNLSGAVDEILDPFCGAGGILLEGGLAGRSMTGIDIDPRQVSRAEENLVFYGVAATLSVGDATACDALGSFDAIVTDLPLGKNAKLTDARATFNAFFDAASKIAKTCIVAIDASYPLAHSFSPFWEEEARFDWRLQKGMVKRIFLLSTRGGAPGTPR